MRRIGELLHVWWRMDRIRISPRAGRLLRLHPPCIVYMEDRPVEIVTRTVSRTSVGPCVYYGCRTADGSAQLCVAPASPGVGEHITWMEHGRERSLAADAVEVWG